MWMWRKLQCLAMRTATLGRGVEFCWSKQLRKEVWRRNGGGGSSDMYTPPPLHQMPLLHETGACNKMLRYPTGLLLDTSGDQTI